MELLSGLIVVVFVPLHRRFDGRFKVCKCVVRQQGAQLGIGRRLLVLSIRFARITDQFSLE